MVRPSSERYVLRGTAGGQRVLQQRGGSAQVGQLVQPKIGGSLILSSATEAKEEVEHYRLWNYIAIRSVAVKVAESFPMVSAAKSIPATGPQNHYSRSQVSYIRQNFPSVTWEHNEELVPVPATHPLVQLFHNVNSQDWYSAFIIETMIFQRLTGEVYWWVVKNAVGLPSEMWVIPSHWVQEKWSKGRDPEQIGWTIIPDGDRSRKFDLELDEVIAWRDKNPLSKRHGWSPSGAGSEWIDNSESIEKSRFMTFDQGPIPMGVIEMDPDAYQKPSEDIIRQIGEAFIQRHGGVERSGEPIIQLPGTKVREWSMTPQEMNYPESSDQIRDTILSLHGVPKAIVGITQDVNRAAMFGAMMAFCKFTVNPILQQLSGVFTEKLAVRFDPRLRVWYEDCAPEDREEMRKDFELASKIGGVKPNEVREKLLGLEAIDDPAYDTAYIPMSMVPLSAEQREADTENRGGSSDADRDQERDDDESDDDVEQSADPKWTQKKFELLPSRAVRQGKRERRFHRIFRRVHKINEDGSAGSLKKFHAAVADLAADRFAAGATERSFPSVEELVPKPEFESGFNDAMSRHWLLSSVAGAEIELDTLGIETEEQDAALGVTQREENPFDILVELPVSVQRDIREFLRQRQVGVWQSVISTTHNRLRRAIQAGIRDGDSIPMIARRIKKVLGPVSSRQRSIVIARTEVTASLNHAQQSVREHEGVSSKVWIATRDDRTRNESPFPDHLSMDEREVPNDEPFDVDGFAMMHPGDGSLGAPAAEIVNCRCTSASAGF